MIIGFENENQQCEQCFKVVDIRKKLMCTGIARKKTLFVFVKKRLILLSMQLWCGVVGAVCARTRDTVRWPHAAHGTL